MQGERKILEDFANEVKVAGQDVAALVDESIEGSNSLSEIEVPSIQEEELIARPASGYEFVQKLDKNSKLYKEDGFKFVVCKECSAELPCGKVVTVPIGFISDGATRGYSGVGEKEWLLHDWLYATKGCLNQASNFPILTRLQSDAVFLTCPQFHRWLAVRLFGGTFWGQETFDSKKRIQPELLKYE